MSRRFAITALSSIGALWALAPAWADDIRVMLSAPKASAVIDGRSSEFFVRFDQPIDHIHSTLSITRDGKVIERLKPRLDSAPQVLFARAPTMAAGDYMLHWSVRTVADVKVTEGDIPFTVRK